LSTLRLNAPEKSFFYILVHYARKQTNVPPQKVYIILHLFAYFLTFRYTLCFGYGCRNVVYCCRACMLLGDIVERMSDLGCCMVSRSLGESFGG